MSIVLSPLSWIFKTKQLHLEQTFSVTRVFYFIFSSAELNERVKKSGKATVNLDRPPVPPSCARTEDENAASAKDGGKEETPRTEGATEENEGDQKVEKLQTEETEQREVRAEPNPREQEVMYAEANHPNCCQPCYTKSIL